MGDTPIPSADAAAMSGTGCEESELFESAQLETLVQLTPPEGSPQTTGGSSLGSTPTTGPLKRGVALLEVTGMHGFFVSGFEGSGSHDITCVWVSDGVQLLLASLMCC